MDRSQGSSSHSSHHMEYMRAWQNRVPRSCAYKYIERGRLLEEGFGLVNQDKKKKKTKKRSRSPCLYSYLRNAMNALGLSFLAGNTYIPRLLLRRYKLHFYLLSSPTTRRLECFVTSACKPPIPLLNVLSSNAVCRLISDLRHRLEILACHLGI